MSAPPPITLTHYSGTAAAGMKFFFRDGSFVIANPSGQIICPREHLGDAMRAGFNVSVASSGGGVVA